MCQCASCTPTDKLAKAGFAAWPRGNPAGKRASESAYAAHVAFSRKWGRHQSGNMHHAPEVTKRVPTGNTRREDPHAGYKFPEFSEETTTADYVAWFLRSNNLLTDATIAKRDQYRAMVKRGEADVERREKASPTYARPARPAQPGKAAQHFPAVDRDCETARIYAMPKAKPKPRPVGRPAMEGRRVVIKLEEAQIKRAEELGNGNISAGIRAALELKRKAGS